MKNRVHACRIVSSPWPGVFGTDTDSAREYDRHWHATFGFGLMQRGAHRSLSGRGIVDARAGDVITTNPGEVHDGRPLGGTSRRWRMIHLDPAVMASMAGRPEPPPTDVRLTRPVIQDPALIPVLRQLLRRLERWSAASQPASDAALGCEEALVRTCGLLLKVHSTAAPSPEARLDVVQVRERLADDLVSPPSLTELAAFVGLSRYQLLRRFERVYGMTPFEWQRQVRAERARALIRTGISLARAAVECGFADQSHMTRAFVGHFGFTPGAWAAALRPSPRPMGAATTFKTLQRVPRETSPVFRHINPVAFGRRCIPGPPARAVQRAGDPVPHGCVAPPSNTLSIPGCRAWTCGRIAGLGANRIHGKH